MEENEDYTPTSLSSGVWTEKIYVVTADYEIIGYIFVPRTGRKGRILSDILNGGKRFIAIKDAEIFYRNNSGIKERHEFIQLNLDTIILLRPMPIE